MAQTTTKVLFDKIFIVLNWCTAVCPTVHKCASIEHDGAQLVHNVLCTDGAHSCTRTAIYPPPPPRTTRLSHPPANGAPIVHQLCTVLFNWRQLCAQLCTSVQQLSTMVHIWCTIVQQLCTPRCAAPSRHFAALPPRAIRSSLA